MNSMRLAMCTRKPDFASLGKDAIIVSAKTLLRKHGNFPLHKVSDMRKRTLEGMKCGQGFTITRTFTEHDAIAFAGNGLA